MSQRSDSGGRSDGGVDGAWQEYLRSKKAAGQRLTASERDERERVLALLDLGDEDDVEGWVDEVLGEDELETITGPGARAATVAPDPARAVAAYQALEAEDRQLVQLLSLACTALRPDELLRVLQHGTLPGHEAKAGQLGARLRDLQQGGVICELDGGTFACAEGSAQLALRELVARPDFLALRRAVDRALQPPPAAGMWSARNSPRSVAAVLREARVAVVTGDETALRKAYLAAERQALPLLQRDSLVSTELGMPFDAAWLRERPRDLQRVAMRELLHAGLYRLADVSAVVTEAWRWWLEQGPALDPGVRQRLAVHLLLRGRVADAQALILGSDDGELLGCAGWVDLATGEVASACSFFEQGLSILQQGERLGGPYYSGTTGVLAAVALLARGRDADLDRLVELEHRTFGHGGMRPALQILAEVAALWRDPRVVRRRRSARSLLTQPAELDLAAIMACWADGLAAWWTETAAAEEVVEALESGARRCRDCGLTWLADQLTDVHLRLTTRAATTVAASSTSSTRSLATLLAPRPLWKRTLEALAAVGRGQDRSTQPERRLAWFLDVGAEPSLQARQQKRTRRGFSHGRQIPGPKLGALARSATDLSPQDVELCRALSAAHEDSYGYHRGLSARVARALLGHPHVFWAGQPDQPVEVAAGRPELHVQRSDDGGVRLHLVPALRGDQEVAILRESPTRALVIELDARQREIAAILGEGLSLPAAAEQKFVEALSSTVTVIDLQSELDVEVDGVEVREADPRPRARIAFFGRELRVELVARPLGDAGPSFPPGVGSATVVTTVEGQRVKVRRDLDDERRRAEACVRGCPTLAALPSPELRWSLSDPQHSLEVLAELRNLGEHVALEWSSQGRMRVRAEAGLTKLRLRVGSARDWFTLSGELRVDEELVLDMKRLLELSELMPGRFVPLGDGEFLALSAELRRRLDALRAFTQGDQGALRFHPLAAGAMAQTLRGTGDVEGGAELEARVAELERALRAEPVLPVELQLELRSYQVEGFAWLSRLATGGMGACLADDMGLGKTAQVLALLLARRDQGPVLVVAPTTVCGTWRDQAARYAPALRVVELGPAARTRTIDALGPGDLLLCSYALLVREIESLRKVAWTTLVLDEAQAVKNATTKRWQAVASLQARARVVTTGTPVENHLDELWSLFEFLNPGLLGSRESFGRRFVLPIERNKDREPLGHLKTLVAPYILRRTKGQVLTELPPRTEIELEVEMGAAERAHYEALRQRAMARLTQPVDGNAQPGHVRILAEITRLRRACSNPAMVSPDAGLPSCKLEACVELLEQLRQGGHRVLVFSQWLDQLAALQQRLDALGFAQLYLDGSTPSAERQQRIDAFQAGRAEVFLISLKAGGQGINLTAADYVVHVDPWWNPAVEDQASDRAHRLGQTRAVTIYRLVVKDSIEQKILALHRDKRDLASQILSGGELSARLSADELLDLIRMAG